MERARPGGTFTHGPYVTVDSGSGISWSSGITRLRPSKVRSDGATTRTGAAGSGA